MALKKAPKGAKANKASFSRTKRGRLPRWNLTMRWTGVAVIFVVSIVATVLVLHSANVMRHQPPPPTGQVLGIDGRPNGVAISTNADCNYRDLQGYPVTTPSGVTVWLGGYGYVCENGWLYSPTAGKTYPTTP